MNDMTDMNDMNDFTLDLNDAASTVDTGDAGDMLASVHATASRRRRRRNAVLGAAAAGTLVVGGVVVAGQVGGDNDNREEQLVTADLIVEPETSDPVDEPVTTPTTAAPVPGGAGAGAVPVSVSEGIPVDVDAAVVTNSSVRLVPWDGGFLAISVEYSAQPLPAELPQEVVDLFPQEVIDFFEEEGLPATIDEATTQLADAGLLDVVSDIVVNNPEASEAIYSQPLPVPDTTFRFSPDGAEWSDLDVQFPADVFFDPWMINSTGDRLVILSDPAQGPGIGVIDDADVDLPDFEMWSTTDLVEWTSTTIARPQRTADTPSYVTHYSFAQPVLATDNAWVVQIESYEEFDVLALLDPDVRADIESQPWGSNFDNDGVSIQVYNPNATGPDDEYAEVLTYTWEELGIERPDDPYGSESTAVSVAGTWDSDVTSTTTTEGFHHGQSVVGDWFVQFGADSTVSVSANGVDWVDYDVELSGYVNGVIAAGDQIAVLGQDGSDFVIVGIDPVAGTMAPIELDGLPENASIGYASDGVAVLFDDGEGSDFEFMEPFETRFTGEVDGYRVELVASVDPEGASEATYTVTDVATGDVVSTESMDITDEPEFEFEFAEEVYDIDGFEEGIRLLDPATGELLVEISFADMTQEMIGADGTVIDLGASEEFAEESEAEFEEFTPDSWLLATDGSSWILDEMPGNDGVSSGIVNNGVLVVATYDGSLQRYEFG